MVLDLFQKNCRLIFFWQPNTTLAKDVRLTIELLAQPTHSLLHF